MEKDLTFGKSYCHCNGTVNGMEVDISDFGEKYDRSPEKIQELNNFIITKNYYICGNMEFTRFEGIEYKIHKLKAMMKYNITEEEFDLLCKELEIKLSFGICNFCS